MSSPKYASPLRFKIITSRLLIIIVSLLHLGAIASLVTSSVPLWAIGTGSLIIPLSLLVTWSRVGWVTKRVGKHLSFMKIWPTFVEVVWDDADQWHLFDEHQQAHPAILMPSTYVSARLVVINLRLEHKPWYCRHRAIVLLSDNIDEETFRRVRIRLRWYSSQVQDNWAVSK